MEITKNLNISFLLDFYGEMLTDKQKEVVSLYYNEDLSLAEIAALCGITRQGVRDSIKRAEKQLIHCEEKLGLSARFNEIQEELQAIRDLAFEINEENRKLGNSALIAGYSQQIMNKTQELKI